MRDKWWRRETRWRGRGGELTRTRDGDKSSTNTTAPFLSWFNANRSPDPKFSTSHVLRTQHDVSQEPNVLRKLGIGGGVNWSREKGGSVLVSLEVELVRAQVDDNDDDKGGGE